MAHVKLSMRCGMHSIMHAVKPGITFAVHYARHVVHHVFTILQRVHKNAKLAHNIKNAVWNVDRACAHAKNTQWALQYWTKLQHADDKDTRGRTIFASM